MAVVDGRALDEAVVEHLAQRRDISAEQARTEGIATLQLVAAARARQRERSETPGLVPRREQHLRRTALARLWLREYFEPNHTAADIPADDPALVRARKDPRIVHPELWMLCQVVIEPAGVETETDKARIAADPQWRAAATTAMQPLVQRVRPGVPVGDDEACRLLADRVGVAKPPADDRYTISVSGLGGYHLDACAEQDDTGACLQPTFAPEWTEVVAAMEVPGFSEPFFTRFGLHWVYAHEHLDAQTADDPTTDPLVRDAVLNPWRAAQLDRALAQMGQQRAVRIAAPSEDAP